MKEIICFISGKGGTGKSTVCAGVALSLAKKSTRVLILDTDCFSRSQEHIFGVSNVVYNLADGLSGAKSLRELAVPLLGGQELFLVPSFTELTFVIKKEALSALLESAGEDFDYVLIDCPADLSENVRAVIGCCTMGVVVANNSNMSVSAGERAAYLLYQSGVPAKRLIANRLTPGKIREGKELDIDQTIDRVHLQLLGAVPRIPRLCRVIERGNMIRLPRKGRKPFSNLAQRLMGQDVPFSDIKP